MSLDFKTLLSNSVSLPTIQKIDYHKYLECAGGFAVSVMHMSKVIIRVEIVMSDA